MVWVRLDRGEIWFMFCSTWMFCYGSIALSNFNNLLLTTQSFTDLASSLPMILWVAFKPDRVPDTFNALIQPAWEEVFHCVRLDRLNPLPSTTHPDFYRWQFFIWKLKHKLNWQWKWKNMKLVYYYDMILINLKHHKLIPEVGKSDQQFFLFNN